MIKNLLKSVLYQQKQKTIHSLTDHCISCKQKGLEGLNFYMVVLRNK